MAPVDEEQLLGLGYGITNIVNFATAQASELSLQMLREGAAVLEKKVARFRPKVLAVLGIDAYRKAFGRPEAHVGPQDEGIDNTEVWVMPSPSGINASYQIADLVRIFSDLRARTENLDIFFCRGDGSNIKKGAKKARVPSGRRPFGSLGPIRPEKSEDRAMSERAILKITNLAKEYGSVRAVDGISFAVGAGEVVGLLGPNGAGKTTTINMILGILEADERHYRNHGYRFEDASLPGERKH